MNIDRSLIIRAKNDNCVVTANRANSTISVSSITLRYEEIIPYLEALTKALKMSWREIEALRDQTEPPEHASAKL